MEKALRYGPLEDWIMAWRLKLETVRRGQISVPPAVGARAVADGASSVY